MWNARKIATDAYINGLALLQSSRDGRVDLLVCVFQIVHHRLIARDRLEAPHLLREVRQPDRVVKDAVRAIIIRIGTTHDADNRQVLAVGARDGVENAQAADGEGHDAGANAAGAGVAVCGVAGIELVAAADVCETLLGDEVVEEGEVEVAGDGEDIGYADLDEAAGHVSAEGGVGGGEDFGWWD